MIYNRLGISWPTGFHAKRALHFRSLKNSKTHQNACFSFLPLSHYKTWTPSSPIPHYYSYHHSLQSVQLLQTLTRQPLLLSRSHRRSSSPASSTALEAREGNWVFVILLLLLVRFLSLQLLPVVVFSKLTKPSSRIPF